jgi:phosphoribosylformylglycinamidine synthase subunit PurS
MSRAAGQRFRFPVTDGDDTPRAPDDKRRADSIPARIGTKRTGLPGWLSPTSRFRAPEGGGPDMKAKIIITPKKAVLDPQGKTVESALAHMGYEGVTGVHVGKYIEIDLATGTDAAAARTALNDACRKFLSNPIIEDYKLEVE